MESETPTSLLLAFEDQMLGNLFAEYLQKLQMQTTAITGLMNEAVVEHLTQQPYDAMVMAAQTNRSELVEQVKEVRDYSAIPLYILLPEVDKELMIALFQAGADDVMILPVSPEIMAHKIGALLHRLTQNERQQTEYRFGHILFNAEKQTLQREDEPQQHLSGKETELLQLLLDHKNQVVEKSLILRRVWRADTYFNGRSLSVYINHLRNFFGNQPDVRIISIHGKGYKLLAENEEQAENQTENQVENRTEDETKGNANTQKAY